MLKSATCKKSNYLACLEVLRGCAVGKKPVSHMRYMRENIVNLSLYMLMFIILFLCIMHAHSPTLIALVFEGKTVY